MSTPNKTAAQRGYTYRWQKARRLFLLEHPLCRFCQREGRLKPATIVDHITPHRGDEELFWDESNWQALCKPCHDAIKQRMEKSGRIIGCDEQGQPLDPSHSWWKS